MTRADGIKKIRALLGNNIRVDVSDHASSPELRAAAGERQQALIAERDALRREIALLEMSVGIPALRVKANELHKAQERAGWEKHWYRISCLRPSGIGWEVLGFRGDGFTEVIEQIKAKQAAKAS